MCPAVPKDFPESCSHISENRTKPIRKRDSKVNDPGFQIDFVLMQMLSLSSIITAVCICTGSSEKSLASGADSMPFLA